MNQRQLVISKYQVKMLFALCSTVLFVVVLFTSDEVFPKICSNVRLLSLTSWHLVFISHALDDCWANHQVRTAFVQVEIRTKKWKHHVRISTFTCWCRWKTTTHTKNQCFIQFFSLYLKGSFALQHLFCMSRSMFANFFVVVFNQIYANVKRGKNHRISLLFLQLTNETVLLEHFSCFYRIFIIFFDAILQ